MKLAVAYPQCHIACLFCVLGLGLILDESGELII